jgi:hypothetical protein
MKEDARQVEGMLVTKDSQKREMLVTTEDLRKKEALMEQLKKSMHHREPEHRATIHG